MGPGGREPSPQALFEAASAIADRDDPHRHELVVELQARDDEQAFRVLAEGAASGEPAAATVALDVLGQLGFRRGRPWLELSLPIVLEATGSADPTVVAAAVRALGHLGDPRGLQAVLGHVGHGDPAVRFAVAFALPSVAGEPTDPAVPAALVTLMADGDEDVRDWATFGLGSQLHADSPEIRQALAARLDDPDGATAAEALVGLARRGDRSIEPRLLTWLAAGTVETLELEAAGELGGPRLLAALERLRESGWTDGVEWRPRDLEAAIEACATRASEPSGPG